LDLGSRIRPDFVAIAAHRYLLTKDWGLQLYFIGKLNSGLQRSAGHLFWKSARNFHHLEGHGAGLVWALGVCQKHAPKRGKDLPNNIVGIVARRPLLSVKSGNEQRHDQPEKWNKAKTHGRPTYARRWPASKLVCQMTAKAQVWLYSPNSFTRFSLFLGFQQLERPDG